MIRLVLRIMAATLMCFIITFFVTSIGAVIGRGVGLEDGHNMGEVVLAFLAGGIIMLIYSRKFDDKEGDHGK